MTDKLTVVIFDAATGETTERPLTANELKQVTDMQAEIVARQAEADAKIAARESALAKLKALGLTEAEISAL
jgi:ABC-type Fe3+-hydroxamate transport system substrate-binding protein